MDVKTSEEKNMYSDDGVLSSFEPLCYLHVSVLYIVSITLSLDVQTAELLAVYKQWLKTYLFMKYI